MPLQAIIENMKIKQDLFRFLDEKAPSVQVLNPPAPADPNSRSSPPHTPADNLTDDVYMSAYRKDCIFASNTSSLSISEIGSAVSAERQAKSVHCLARCHRVRPPGHLVD